MTGIIILAAGASTRLGEPKQMLQYQGKALLQRAVQAADDTGCKPIIVVVGSNHKSVSREVDTSAATIIYNPDWALGMASSIKIGITELQKFEPALDGAIVMLCDQPFVDAKLLKALKDEKLNSGKKIVACSYKNTLGVPVLFDQKYFEDLLLLQGEEGAKSLIKKYKEDVSSIPFPRGAIDIDTKDDYRQLLSNSNSKE
jgi:molybdenum cofactor cytidylyltransferase